MGVRGPHSDARAAGWYVLQPTVPPVRAQVRVESSLFCAGFRAHARVPADPGENTQSTQTDPQLEGKHSGPALCVFVEFGSLVSTVSSAVFSNQLPIVPAYVGHI